MAQQVADDLGVRAGAEEVDGAAVAEDGGGCLDGEMGLTAVVGEFSADAAGGEGAAVAVDEQNRGCVAGDIRFLGTAGDVLLDSVGGPCGQAAQTRWTAGGVDADGAAVGAEVRRGQLDEFADAQAGAVEHGDDGAVAGGEPMGGGNGVEEPLEVGLFEEFKGGRTIRGGAYGGEGVGGKSFFGKQIGVKSAECGELSTAGGRGVTVAEGVDEAAGTVGVGIEDGRIDIVGVR